MLSFVLSIKWNLMSHYMTRAKGNTIVRYRLQLGEPSILIIVVESSLPLSLFLSGVTPSCLRIVVTSSIGFGPTAQESNLTLNPNYENDNYKSAYSAHSLPESHSIE